MEDIELQRNNNIILNEAIARINEQEREKQRLELLHQKNEHEQMENYFIKRNEFRKEEERNIEYLYKKNSELNIDILEDEKEHKLDLKEIENEYDIKLNQLENSHEQKMYSLDLELIENKRDYQEKIGEINLIEQEREYKNKLNRKIINKEHNLKMRGEYLFHRKKMKDIDDNIQINKLNNDNEIKMNIIKTEVESKIIEHEIKVDKIKNEIEYEKKLLQQKSFENDALLKQNKEKIEMELKFELMLHNLILDKKQNLKNS